MCIVYFLILQVDSQINWWSRKFETFIFSGKIVDSVEDQIQLFLTSFDCVNVLLKILVNSDESYDNVYLPISLINTILNNSKYDLIMNENIFFQTQEVVIIVDFIVIF